MTTVDRSVFDADELDRERLGLVHHAERLGANDPESVVQDAYADTLAVARARSTR